MDPLHFCLWLQGMLEGGQMKALGRKQLTLVRKHLALVFTNVTDQMKAPTQAEAQRVTEQALHSDLVCAPASGVALSEEKQKELLEAIQAAGDKLTRAAGIDLGRCGGVRLC